MSAHRSEPSLLVLLAVRLSGVATTEQVLDRTLLPEAVVGRELGRAASVGEVEDLDLGLGGGVVLTESGRLRLAELLAAELSSAGAREIAAEVLDSFEAGINTSLVGALSHWQLADGALSAGRSTTGDAAPPAELLETLDELGGALRELLRPLMELLPRFGRYPSQYRIALERARSGESRWIAGIGILSCHVVWAELHQDLLSTLGRLRGFQHPAGPENTIEER